jgi:tetratricopeptide (TPR) repeat protein
MRRVCVGGVLLVSSWVAADNTPDKTREAVATARRQIALHPKEAAPHDQLAEIYREVGMGIAARREARLGVQIEPRSSDAHAKLAWQLRHDSLGIDFGFDYDRKGALAEYRKALELDPSHLEALDGAATLLTRDETGAMTLNQQDLLEAASLFRHANGLGANRAGEQLAMALLDAGSFAEAETAARAHAKGLAHDVVVAAVAGQHGTEDAIAAAKSLSKNPTKMVEIAGGLLVLTRRYDVARALYAKANITTDDFDPVTLANLREIDPRTLDPGDPKTAALELIAVAFGLPVPQTPWRPEFVENIHIRRGFEPKGKIQSSMWGGIPRTVAFDMVAASTKISITATTSDGWKVDVELGGKKTEVYVLNVRGRAMVLGDSENREELGRHALDLLAKNDVATATRWMQWATHGSPMAKLLESPQGDPPRAAVELVAAMFATDIEGKRTLPIVKRCAVDGADAKATCRIFLASALTQTERWSDLAEVERERVEIDHDETVRWSYAYALLRVGRLDEATAVVDAALAKTPDDASMVDNRLLLAVATGKWEEVHAWLDRLAAHPHAGADELNTAAWTYLYFGKSLDDARAVAARVERSTTALTAGEAHTIASIEAELDHPVEAWKYLQKAVMRRRGMKPIDMDWYVVGRIAETLELRNDAIAGYRRVTKPKVSSPIAMSPYDMAQRALRRLGAR